MGEMSEASEDDIDVLFPALAPPIPAIGEPHPSFAQATLQDLECLTQKRTNQQHLYMLMYAQSITIYLSFIHLLNLVCN